MASKRYVLELKSSGGVVNASNPVAYDQLADAVAAGNTAAPAGGYKVVDAWKMGYVLINTTGVKDGGLTDLTVNCNTAKNYLGVASETFPI